MRHGGSVEATGTANDAAVFDLGGVLVDWNPRHLYRRLFDDPADMEHFLATVCTQAWHDQHDRGRPMRETIPELIEQHPGYANYIAAWARQDEMYGGAHEDTVEILAALRPQVRLLALTNWPDETFSLLRRFEFLEWFEGIIVSGVEGIAKPDRAIFELLTSRYELNPPRTLFVDDSTAHVEAAASIGYRTHHFTAPAQLKQELEHLGLPCG